MHNTKNIHMACCIITFFIIKIYTNKMHIQKKLTKNVFILKNKIYKNIKVFLPVQ